MPRRKKIKSQFSTWANFYPQKNRLYGYFAKRTAKNPMFCSVKFFMEGPNGSS